MKVSDKGMRGGVVEGRDQNDGRSGFLLGLQISEMIDGDILEAIAEIEIEARRHDYVDIGVSREFPHG